ncbi:MAG: HU family DNA-binding protein [bacterium]|nr:HU family DNA-binding protein [bacterium]
MNNNDFVQAVAIKAGLTNEEAEKLIGSLVAILGEKLRKNPDLEIEGLGRFSLDGGKIIFEIAR